MSDGEAVERVRIKTGVARTARPSVTVFDAWHEAASRWDRLSDGPDTLPFQRAAWLAPWYRHHAGPGREPAIVILSDKDTGTDVLGLPLIVSRHGGGRTLTFADDGLTDYNAPAFGAGECVASADLWRSLRSALPSADRAMFEKMPARVGSRLNPLAALRGTRPMRLAGNVLEIGDWEAWRKGLERTFRKELGRSGRVFDAIPGAQFRALAAGDAAMRIYRDLETLQRARIADLALPYRLDAAPVRAFYNDIISEGLDRGTAILTALTVGEETVAALLGISDGHHYAMTRLATPGARWKHVSPGRLLIVRTMEMLHAQGFRSFDFTIGDYAYKRRLGVTPVPLVALDRALTWRGVPGSLACNLTAVARADGRVRGLAATARALKHGLVRKTIGRPRCQSPKTPSSPYSPGPGRP